MINLHRCRLCFGVDLEKIYHALQWRHNGCIGVSNHITSLAVVYLTVYSGADQRKHQSSASLAFVRGIHRTPVNSPHKGPVTRKIYPFDDVFMHITGGLVWWLIYASENRVELIPLCRQVFRCIGTIFHHYSWDLYYPGRRYNQAVVGRKRKKINDVTAEWKDLKYHWCNIWIHRNVLSDRIRTHVQFSFVLHKFIK